MQTTPRCFILAAALAVIAIAPLAHAADNELTAQEKTAGWQLLFDGKSFDGWRGYRMKAHAAVPGWEVTKGTLHTLVGVTGIELITEKKFEDFELSWEWKLSPAGNNGIKYFVTEDRPKSPGHEYQMLDDTSHKYDDLPAVNKTAAFYDVLPAAADKPLRPVGEWNTSKLVVHGNKVEHWLNGARVLSYELGSAEVKAGIAKSKFKSDHGFGDKITGPIMLTYHEDECWYRNIKLRELK